MISPQILDQVNYMSWENHTHIAKHLAELAEDKCAGNKIKSRNEMKIREAEKGHLAGRWEVQVADGIS